MKQPPQLDMALTPPSKQLCTVCRPWLIELQL